MFRQLAIIIYLKKFIRIDRMSVNAIVGSILKEWKVHLQLQLTCNHNIHKAFWNFDLGINFDFTSQKIVYTFFP